LPKFQALWKIIKIVLVVQIINAAMDYYVWVAYGFLVPSWAIATVNLFNTLLVLAVKTAQEKEMTAKK